MIEGTLVESPNLDELDLARRIVQPFIFSPRTFKI